MGTSCKTLSSRAEQFLLQQYFPGNVRELRNIIERAITLSDDENIDLDTCKQPHYAAQLRLLSACHSQRRKNMNRLIKAPALQ